MVWITIILLPLGLLIGLQIGFLAYHSEDILSLQRYAIAIDLLLLSVFWPIIRAPDGKWFTWLMRATGLITLISWVSRRLSENISIRKPEIMQTLMQRNYVRYSGRVMIEGIFSFVILLAVIAFSWGVAVLPDSDNEKQVAGWVTEAAMWFIDQSYENEGLICQSRWPNWIAEFSYSSASSVNTWLSIKPVNKVSMITIFDGLIFNLFDGQFH